MTINQIDTSRSNGMTQKPSRKAIGTAQRIALISIALLAVFAGTSYAQEIAAQPAIACPPDKVCISPEAARQALEDSDTVKFQKTEIATLKQAVEDFRKELNNMRIEFARASGENTALKQNAVSDRAIIEILLKNSKKRCAPFSILCL